VWNRLLLALSLLALWPAIASGSPGFPVLSMSYAPATALSGDRVVVAWASGGYIRTATRSPGGAVGPSQVVGLSGDGRSPLLASAPNGDLILVWLGRDGLQSAFRPAGGRAWTFEPIAPDAIGSKQAVKLVVDSSGRAIVTDEATGAFSGVAVFTHVEGGAWTEFALPDRAAQTQRSVSIATDTGGDIAIVYLGLSSDGATVLATVLLAGSSTWSDPVAISEPATLASLTTTLAGGGNRTFLATWTEANAVSEGAPVTVAARLRLPGTWEPQRVVIPPESGPLAVASNVTPSVDENGNATAVWQYPTDTASALGIATLPGASTVWGAPETFDQPLEPGVADAPPAVATARDGSTTVAFVQRRADGFWLRVATKTALGTWIGQDADVGRISTCSGSSTCLWEQRVPPSSAFDGRTIAIAAKTSAGVVLVRGTTPGASWSPPASLRPADTTNVYLRTAHVRDGSVQVAGSCGVAFCGGTAVIRTISTSSRVLGSVSLNGPPDDPHRVTLPSWARARLRHGTRLRVELVATWYEDSDVLDRSSLIVALHA
jgi:hypothetical protein